MRSKVKTKTYSKNRKAFAGGKNFLQVNRKLVKNIGCKATCFLAHLVSQLDYFEGRGKLSGGWFFSTHKAIEDQIGLTAKEQRSITTKLKSMNLIETKLVHGSGLKTLNYFLIKMNNIEPLVSNKGDKKSEGLSRKVMEVPAKKTGMSLTKGDAKDNRLKENKKKIVLLTSKEPKKGSTLTACGSQALPFSISNPVAGSGVTTPELKSNMNFYEAKSDRTKVDPVGVLPDKAHDPKNKLQASAIDPLESTQSDSANSSADIEECSLEEFADMEEAIRKACMYR
jgi:hypothetical protein